LYDFGIRIAFFSLDGRELKVGNNVGICRYCQSIRMCKGGAAACNNEDREGRKLAFSRKKLVIYTCHAGMTEIVKPIIKQGNLLGYAMIGQIRTITLPPSNWTSLWDSHQSEKLADIFRSQPLISESNLIEIIEMFSHLMELLTSNNMIDSIGIDMPSRLSGYIQKHINEALSLSDACEAMNLSQSRLSHVVKERYGISYTTLVRTLKMEHARFLLSHYSDMAISEVSLAVGYVDPQYFSKVFRQVSGLSPTLYRKQQLFPQS